MAKGKVVKINRVMPFCPNPEGGYVSRMLIDVFNSGSEKLQVNHGTLKGGGSFSDAVHKVPHDELYIVLSGQAVLTMDGVKYDIEEGSVVFIPGGTLHGLVNKSQTENFEIITVWPGQPAPGANVVYDMRKKEWGTTYREVEKK